jgi:hypothetical protein
MLRQHGAQVPWRVVRTVVHKRLKKSVVYHAGNTLTRRFRQLSIGYNGRELSLPPLELNVFDGELELNRIPGRPPALC